MNYSDRRQGRQRPRQVALRLTCLPLLAFLVLPISATRAQSANWPQWGGPDRNFKSSATGLAPSWPAGGPRKLWRRELGEGFSGIAIEDGKLFMMYRKGGQELVVSLDAATGKTLWEYGYDAPFSKEYDMSNGPGPHATPLVAGELVWSHDLIKEFDGTLRVNGYSCSPLAYKNTVVMQVGGTGHALIAFNQKDGSVVWKKQDFKNSTSSPILINVDGQTQLVAFMFDDIVGVDPNNGDLLWSHPHETEFGLNTSTPVWGEDNLLFVSSGYNGGSRVLKLTQSNGKTSVEELWSHRLMRVHFGTCIRVGDYVYGSSGDFGPAPFTAVNVKTGKIGWRDRSFARASFVFADGHFIVLDEDGHLALASLTSEGLKVDSRVELLSGLSWTPPALAGTTLYVRDRKNMMALDLR